MSCQPSAAAVNAAHVEITAFTVGLAAQVEARAISVTRADRGYLAQEAESATKLTAVAQSVTSV
ncbi:hypothetical protein DQP57_25700 [Mycobacterium colombiense]|uniref:Uncharacterized protein n=1 Tax=Mycobacterium colombiense TaxID=339268 RepID=A0A329L5C1_9MYCO|nr:hypothetical protein DQP57_25700 [Mycobacterium colombiense]